MTDNLSSTVPKNRAKPQPKAQRLGNFVGSRVSNLQARYLNGDNSARVQLANLRACVAQPLGASFTAWEIVFNDFPPELMGNEDKPSNFELAAQLALSLFALHCQSASEPIHVSGIGFGTAVRHLAEARKNNDQDSSTEEPKNDSATKDNNQDSSTENPEHDSPTMRRFHELGTADSFSAVQYRARGLIQLMRANEIQLDYGLFAKDLCDFLFPEYRNGVRLRWARDYYRVPKTTPETANEQKQN